MSTTAALHASVSASFTIEQQGLPRLSHGGSAVGNETAIEEWNGESPSSRLKELRKRMDDDK